MTFTVDWFDVAAKSNFERELARFKGQPNLKFLEVGSYEGRASCWMLENILTQDSSRLTCIDTFEGSMEHHIGNRPEELKLATLYDRFLDNIERWQDKVEVKVGYSQIILREMPVDEVYDFIYIDGSHMAKDVLEDGILAWRMLKPGGLMIFDDYEWVVSADKIDHPKMAVDIFVELYGREIVDKKFNYQSIITKASK
jgi:predicted O-methyltransferase YrrM